MMTLLNRRLRAHGRLLRNRVARVLLSTIAMALVALPAHAVIIRGRVTDALGKAVPGARVQLIKQGQVAAVGYATASGNYEIRSADAGRFTLLSSSAGFLPAIGQEFYGGVTDVVERDLVLSAVTVQQAVSVSATGIPTPVPQLTAPVSVIPGGQLATHVGVVDTLRQTPGVFLAQSGQGGGVTSLFLRGGNSTANLVLVDGIPAEDVGGTFDFGTVSSTAIDRIEVYRGPDSGIYGTDAGAGVVTIETPRGYTLKPVIDYTGDAGTLHQYRNEATVGGTYKKLDYLGAFSRYNTSNALPNDEFHATTAAANIGYSFSGNADVRFTIRNTDAAQGLPGPYDFYNITNTAKMGDQDLYSGLTAEYRTAGNWHNLVRYGIARKREQQTQFGNVGNPITFNFGTEADPDYFTEYFGNPVLFRGANGYMATGQAAFLTGTDDQSSNRDQLYYQSDWTPGPLFNVLAGFRYDNERGSYNNAEFFEHERIQRTNYEYNLQFQGEVKGRFSYSLGGAVEKNHLYGTAGTPRIGFTYVPVRPSAKWFHGTRLRANAATGVQEPTLALEFNSLYTQLLNSGDTTDIAAYHVGPQGAERSRTYDVGVDQNILGEKLVLRAGYFHNIFDHQLEGVGSEALAEYFGIGTICGSGVCPFSSIYEAYVNSLAYRAQGAELEVQWQPTVHWMVRGGYTYLDTVVLQSFASDAVAANQGAPTENPDIPGVRIGAESPLVGARVFRRPPHTGFTTVEYARQKYSVLFQGAYASRSDDSTFLDGLTPNSDNTLLLPNRDLDFGYAKLDLGGTYAIGRRITVFAQAQNLMNNQHIGPIGYPSLPLTARAGLKIRIGGD
ncbi:MAG TPA: TonB-dependent receptor [Bryocella sp.]|nr:TonB-dependent receptor [Bryocella sp.]